MIREIRIYENLHRSKMSIGFNRRTPFLNIRFLPFSDSFPRGRYFRTSIPRPLLSILSRYNSVLYNPERFPNAYDKFVVELDEPAVKCLGSFRFGRFYLVRVSWKKKVHNQ